MKKTLLAMACLLSGCASQAETASMDMVPVDYEEQIRARIVDDFVDPGSVRDAEISEPFAASGVFDGLSPIPRSGWAVCLLANARNRMGGYTGQQPTIYLFRDGRVDLVVSSDGGRMLQVDYHCSGARYRPLKL